MKRISSNLTLFLKLFIPVFWLVFYGSFTVAFWAMDQSVMPLMTSMPFRIGFTAFYLLGTAFIYFTLFQLKRVDIDADYLYVSNYFKTYRYPYPQVKRVTQTNYYLFKTTQIHFAEKQSFGHTITFLARRGAFTTLARQFPDFMKEIAEDEL